MKHKNIIFIHGWASGPYVWLYQVSFFKDKYNAYTPELAGYGKKILPNEVDVFEYTVQDINDFIVKNKLDNLCIVGWSFGGMVGLKVASDLKNRIHSLVLIDTTVRFVRSDDFKYAISKEVVEKIYTRMQTNFDATLRWFYRFCFSSNERSRNEFGEVIKILGEFIAPFDHKALLAGLNLLMKLDIRHLLADIAIPTLIIHGNKDQVSPKEAAQYLKKRLKNARLHLIDNAGHAPFLTEPKKVNALIEDFISR